MHGVSQALKALFRIIATLAILVVVFFLVMFIYALIIWPEDDSPQLASPPKEITVDEGRLRLMCEGAIENSANFGFDWTNNIFEGTRKFSLITKVGDRYILQGRQLRLKNEYGTELRRKRNYTCVYDAREKTISATIH